MTWYRLISLVLALSCAGATYARAQSYEVTVDGKKEKPATAVSEPAAPSAAEPKSPLTTATSPSANPLAPVKRSDDDLVLVDLMLDDQLLAQGLQGFVSKGSVMLPLGQLAEALELSIKVSQHEGVAHGWFYREDNLFSLDMGRREAVIGGQTQAVDAHLAEIHDDDIYVDTALLGSWLSLQLDFYFNSQTVKITPKNGVKLPIELTSEREKRQGRLRNRTVREGPHYPERRVPYRWASLPFIDVSGQTTLNGRQKNTGGGVQLTNDLLYMQNKTFLNISDKQGLNDVRMTLSRRDAGGKLFSPDEPISDTWLGQTSDALQLSEVAVGDINSLQLPLTARGQSGRGLTASNQRLDRATEFNRTTIDGTILPNWDIELYRNDELLDFQRASDNGRYEFADVPLFSGTNIIRLVFYGPQGETREEVRRILVRPEITKQGESYFRVTTMQQNSSLLQVREQNQQKRSLITAPQPTGLERANMDGRFRSSFEYEYGMADNLALYSSLASVPSGTGEQREYASVGTGLSYRGVFGRFDTATSDHGGSAYQANIQSNIYNVNLSARHQEFHNFTSDVTGSLTEPLLRRSEARVDMPVNFWDWPALNVGVGNTRTQYENGRIDNVISQRMSSYLFRYLQLSNELSWQTSSVPGSAAAKQTRGSLTVGMPIWDFVLRGQLGYDVAPKVGINAIQISTDYQIPIYEDYTLRTAIRRDELTKFTTYTLGIDHTFEHIRLGLSGNYTSDRSFSAGLTFGFALDPNSWQVSGKEMASEGMVSARVYLDKNNNGAYDEGDELLPGVNVRSDGGGNGLTDKNGTTLLRGMRSQGASNVTIDESSLENAYWVVKDKGYSVVTRPGVPVDVDFAVLESGDVEGDVFIEDEKGKQEVASNVIIQVVNDKGEVVREEKSSFDGYYLIDRVAVGKYRLRVSPEQLKRRNLVSSGEPEVEMKAEGIIKQKFVLKRGPENEAPAAPEEKNNAKDAGPIDVKKEPDAVAAPVDKVETKTDDTPPAPATQEEEPAPAAPVPAADNAEETTPEPAIASPPAPEKRKRFPQAG